MALAAAAGGVATSWPTWAPASAAPGANGAPGALRSDGAAARAVGRLAPGTAAGASVGSGGRSLLRGSGG